jgi:hypothetical protein
VNRHALENLYISNEIIFTVLIIDPDEAGGDTGIAASAGTIF